MAAEQCWEWGRKHMQYSLCTARDGVSLGLGLVSVACWVVAEIPQINTNYREKSTEGLSLAFLVTWILGDLFNLFGCMLETATLPTQYYTAVLYTVTTISLTVQTIYYGYIYPRLKSNLRQKTGPNSNLTEVPGNARKCNTEFVGKQVNHAGRSHTFDIPSTGNVLSSPIALPGICPSISPRRESYYISARSLSRSHTPTAGSHIAQRMAPTLNHIRNPNEEPLLAAIAATQSAPSTNIKTTFCVVFLMTVFGMFTRQSTEYKLDLIVSNPNQGVVIQVGRKLLQVSSGLLKEKSTEDTSGIGHFLGWGIAAIYIGGRLPQILLNIQKGNVEGLNPLMFVFAVVGNSTYVASILVSSLEWSKIRPNLPWLVDAGGCVLLDIFILIQFFRYWRRPEVEGKDVHSNAA